MLRNDQYNSKHIGLSATLFMASPRQSHNKNLTESTAEKFFKISIFFDILQHRKKFNIALFCFCFSLQGPKKSIPQVGDAFGAGG